jgi:putative spermidine/putrescine transport system substrate-binding protein
MARFWLKLLLVLGLAVILPGFASAGELYEQAWEKVLAQAKGSTVRYYGWGGSAMINKWIDGYVAKQMKERYGIKLTRTPMDAAVFVNKLLTEKLAGKETGSIDLLWINGENFKKTAEAGCLWGPFARALPNNNKYVNPNTVTHDFGYPVGHRESPYGRAQFVLEYDTARVKNPPGTFEELLEWAKAHPGRFTYPQPPDFTGSAFIRQAFYALTGGHLQYLKGWDQGLYNEQAPKLWKYLLDLMPYLWQKGRAYPKDSAALDTLFARGEIDFCMSYHPTHAAAKILEGSYPATVRTFVMKGNSIYNTHFLTIPFNAPNKAAAMVLANFLLSPEAQLSKFQPKNWGDFPALDMRRLPEDWRNKFMAVDLGKATLSPAELAKHAVPEIASQYLEALEAGWEKQVLR